jgi:hypothetical protein
VSLQYRVIVKDSKKDALLELRYFEGNLCRTLEDDRKRKYHPLRRSADVGGERAVQKPMDVTRESQAVQKIRGAAIDYIREVICQIPYLSCTQACVPSGSGVLPRIG